MPREGVFVYNNRQALTDITELGIPLDVLEISVQSCRVSNVPKDFFMKFTRLESLNLQNNYIPILPDLPPNVTYLNMSYNRLTEFVLDAANNQRLEVIDIKYNLIPEYPVIVNKPEGLIIHYKGNNREYDQYNELDFFAQQALNRRREVGIRGANVGAAMAIDNRQKIIEATNVHDSKIQSNTHKSIEYLLGTIPTQQELDYDQQYFKYDPYYRLGIIGVYGDIIKEEMGCMQKLFGNSGNLILSYRALLKEYDELTTTIMFDYGRERGCTMSQIIERIWVISKYKRTKLDSGRYTIEPRSTDEQRSIISNLIIQMEDGEKMCFVGKFTRVVSSLVSFDENIQLEISFPVRFGNAVDYFKAKGTYTKENLIRFVNDSELEDNEKHTWIKSIDDMFEEEMAPTEPAVERVEHVAERVPEPEPIPPPVAIPPPALPPPVFGGFVPWRG